MLAPESPDAARIDLLLQYILAVAAEQDDFWDRELGPIHLLKYAYLADVAHARRKDGETFTGARWRFYHFGPWALEVFERIEPALAAVHAEMKRISSKYGDDFVRYRMESTEEARQVKARGEETLPLSVQFAVTRAVQEFGPDTASLLHSVYQTPPMLNAAPDEALNFGVLVRETTADYAVDPSPHSTSAHGKARKRRLNDLRAEVQARLERAAAAKGNEVPEPRYDDVFAAGVQWLDALAGEPVRESEGKLTIGQDVWKSGTRRESDVP